MLNQKKLEDFLKKAEKIKQSGSVDLSSEADLVLAIMNLLSLEEHFFFTGAKTEKSEYFDFLIEVRDLRKELLAKIVDRNEGETWCASKHLLAAAMRLIEVGVKFRSQNKLSEAKEMFNRAYQMYSMFWALRFKLIDVSGFKKISSEEKPWTFKDIVNKLVDCCNE